MKTMYDVFLADLKYIEKEIDFAKSKNFNNYRIRIKQSNEKFYIEYVCNKLRELNYNVEIVEYNGYLLNFKLKNLP